MLSSKTNKEIIQLKVEKVVFPGKGLAHYRGKPIFIYATIENETVTAFLLKENRKFANALPVEIVEKSPLRITPSCPYSLVTCSKCTDISSYCPGCTYQHIKYEHELSIKQSQFIEFLSRNIPQFNPSVCHSPVPSPTNLFYRNKIVLHALKTQNKFLLGYFSTDNTTIVNINSCHLAMHPINCKISEISANITNFLQNIETPLRITFRAISGKEAIFWKENSSIPQITIHEPTIIGNIQTHPTSFFQINPAVMNLLLSDFIQTIKNFLFEKVVDLYGGVGIFGLAAAMNGAKKTFISDIDPLAINYASLNARALNIHSVSTVIGSAEKVADSIWDKENDRTLLILDPPRTGLSRKIVSKILHHKPATICYISCAPDTLARDMQLLTKSVYQLKETRFFDMFPRTPYFESLSWLSLRK